jgi:hypothetical protein
MGFYQTEELEMALRMTDDVARLGFVPSEADCSFMLDALRKSGEVDHFFLRLQFFFCFVTFDHFLFFFLT